MITGIFKKTIILDTDEVLASPPDDKKMHAIVEAYCRRENLPCSFISQRVVDIDGIEYDVIPTHLFRGTYSVRLRRR